MRGGLEVVPAQAHNLNDACASHAPATTLMKQTVNAPEFLKRQSAVLNLIMLLIALKIKHAEFGHYSDEYIHKYTHRRVKFVK